jgi:Ca2+:H+ antiporter
VTPDPDMFQLMTLAAIAIVLPAAYSHSQFPLHKPFSSNNASSVAEATLSSADAQRGLEIISHGTAVLLLLVYIAYLFFEVRTNSHCLQ